MKYLLNFAPELSFGSGLTPKPSFNGDQCVGLLKGGSYSFDSSFNPDVLGSIALDGVEEPKSLIGSKPVL